MRYATRATCLMALVGLSGLFSFRANVQAQKNVMGQLQLTPTTKVAKTSGVWIDGQYVGYLGELKGGNRLKLLPGEHALIVRQAGYFDFNKKVVIEPKSVTPVRVAMERDSRFIYPDPKTSSEVRLNVQPGRAAVFLDDYYVGTVDEYYGIEHAMLVAPGKHHFKIALPGYRTFETEVELFPRQKFELRTDLMGGSIKDADALIRTDLPAATSSVDQTSPRAAR
jgi:PEGA domain